MPQKKKELKDIRTSLFSRGLMLAKASVKAGRLTATQMLRRDGTQKPGWLNQIEFLIDEIGQLKGTAMKVGQTLSMYGEHLLPPELNEVIKKLQQNSPPLEWKAIEKVLVQELGAEKLAQLEIDPVAIASASIGQVHRAVVKATGQQLALKVQYPGVDLAVETDLKLLKFMLSMSDFIPRGPRLDQIFAEIRDMFQQEVDYTQELSFTQTFYNLLEGNSRYAVPFPETWLSTRRVFAASYMRGYRADAAEVQALSLERRNRLGLAFLQLYLRELLEVQLVQTDPHLGNYLIEINEESAQPDTRGGGTDSDASAGGADSDSSAGVDRLVLLDFGATRRVPEDFLKGYVLLIEGGAEGDRRKIERAGRMLKLLMPEDSVELVNDYIEVCQMLMEPFTGVYDWGNSDLPKRVAAKITKLAVNYRLRSPPRELVFLDRKLGGVFIFLSVLKCKMDSRPALDAALAKFRASRASLDRG